MVGQFFLKWPIVAGRMYNRYGVIYAQGIDIGGDGIIGISNNAIPRR
jgi:hypothetical protein